MKMKLLLALATMATTAHLFAATSATLELRGTISPVLDISISDPSGAASSLDLTASQTDLEVATATEKSNSKTGYKVLIKSANNAKLSHELGDASDNIPYTLKYDGQAVALSSSDVVAKTVTDSGVVQKTSPIAISYEGAPAAERKSGVYSDTLTLTIAVN